jgi:Response regulator receiver domain
MDVQMPILDGIDATRRIAADPRLAGVHVVILTKYGFDEHVFNALRAGAGGFLVKDIEPADLLHAIRVAARGNALLAPAITRRLISEYVSWPPGGQVALAPVSCSPTRTGPASAGESPSMPASPFVTTTKPTHFPERVERATALAAPYSKSSGVGDDHQHPLPILGYWTRERPGAGAGTRS